MNRLLGKAKAKQDNGKKKKDKKKDKKDRNKPTKPHHVIDAMKKGKTIWVGSPTPPFLETYKRGRQLGEAGQFGVTYRCWKISDDDAKTTNADGSPEDDLKCVAVKHINKTRYYRIAEKYRRRILAQMQDEIGILRTIDHKYVVKLKGLYEDKATLYLVMELCTGGELFARIVKRRHYNETDAARVAKQLFEALLYMQDVHSIVHCDLKPDNIMFSNQKEDADVKIIDFGMSKVLPRLQYLTHLCGTPYYTAPEIVTDKKYSYPVDMWSMGVILFVMVFGYPPFYVDPAKYGKHERDAIYQKIRQGFVPQVRNTATKGYGPWFPDHIPSSPEVRDLIANLLQTNIKSRYTATDALQHPWIVNGGVSTDAPAPAAMNQHVLRQIAKFSNSNKFKLVVLKLFRNEFVRMRPQHFARLEEIFQQMDTDGDGVVTLEEFQSAVVQVEEINLSKDQIVQMFQSLNTNDDEKEPVGDHDIDMRPKGIVFGDLLNALVHGYLIDCDERLYAAFLALDEDMDGKITVEQLKDKLREIDPLGEYDKAMELIEKQSFGKDGNIDYEEFLLALHPAFEEKNEWYPEVFTNMKSVQFSPEQVVDEQKQDYDDAAAATETDAAQAAQNAQNAQDAQADAPAQDQAQPDVVATQETDAAQDAQDAPAA